MTEHKFTELDEILASFGHEYERVAFLRALQDPEVQNQGWTDIGRVHDWRNYVSDQVALIWQDLTSVARALIYLEAERLAGNEEWE